MWKNGLSELMLAIWELKERGKQDDFQAGCVVHIITPAFCRLRQDYSDSSSTWEDKRWCLSHTSSSLLCFKLRSTFSHESCFSSSKYKPRVASSYLPFCPSHSLLPSSSWRRTTLMVWATLWTLWWLVPTWAGESGLAGMGASCWLPTMRRVKSFRPYARSWGLGAGHRVGRDVMLLWDVPVIMHVQVQSTLSKWVIIYMFTHVIKRLVICHIFGH